MSVELVLRTNAGMPDPGLRLPASALISAPNGSAVLRLDDNKAQRVPVEVLATTDDGVILSGVSEGDRIVTRGASLIRDGQIVAPLSPSETRYPE